MELCLGTVQLGMDYGIQRAGQPTTSDAFEILGFALHSGISAIDTAAAYGTAETIVGAFIKKHGNIRENLELISKLSPTALVDVPQEHYAATIRECLMQSLRKLNAEYLDGYLLHNPAHIYEDVIADAILKLKQEGLVKRIGASVYTPDEAKKGIERGFDLLQIPYSVFDQRMDEQGVLELAERKSVKLHSRSAFTQGLMLMDESDIPPRLEAAKPVVRKLSRFCEEHCITRLQLAIAFVGRQKSVSHLVFGVDRKEQLVEIVGAYDHPIAEGILYEAAKQFSGLDEDIAMPSKWGR